MNQLQTKSPEVRRLLAELLTGLKDVLGKNTVGVYVYGSLAWGDFNETHSNIDVLVILNKEVSSQEFQDLDNLHAQLTQHYPSWNDRIEIAYALANLVELVKEKNAQIALISPGERFQTKEAGTDWLINYYLLQNKSIVLYGPLPQSITEPISRCEFIEYVKQQSLEWLEWIPHTKNSLGYQYYVVLTLCRALFVIYHQQQGSKLKAGSWAAKQLPRWGDLIQRALERTGQETKDSSLIQTTYEEVVLFVDDILKQITKN